MKTLNVILLLILALGVKAQIKKQDVIGYWQLAAYPDTNQVFEIDFYMMLDDTMSYFLYSKENVEPDLTKGNPYEIKDGQLIIYDRFDKEAQSMSNIEFVDRKYLHLFSSEKDHLYFIRMERDK